MKCKKCLAEVPPQWVHAISSNVCPSCGETLLDTAEMQLLSEVKEALQQMPNNAEALAGWLLSNYRLQKVGTAEPTKFHQKFPKPAFSRANPAGEEQPEVEAAPVPKLVNKFLQRSGVTPPDPEKARELVAKIKSGLSSEPMEDSEDISIDGNPAFDPEQEAVMQMLQGASPNPTVMSASDLKRLHLREEMASTGSVGKISRSS